MKRQTSNKKTMPRQEPHRKKQPKLSPRPNPRLGVVALPQVAGKTVDELVMANSYDDHGIDIFFDDQSGISFSFETELKMKVSQSDGRKDIWRPVRRWSKPKPL